MAKKKKPKKSSAAGDSSPADKAKCSESDGKEAVSGTVLAEEAVEPKADHRSIEEKLEELTPEEAAMFARILAITMKRRRVMLFGYLCALIAVLVGTMWALYMYGTHEPGTFIGWVFLISPAAAGVIIVFFGRWSKRIE